MEELDLLFSHFTNDPRMNKDELNKILKDEWKKLLSYLYWNDLLRLRRVSKSAKALADKYIRENGETLCPEIRINDASKREKTLAQFLLLEFPPSRLYLMNTSGALMFENEKEHFDSLVQMYGQKITHLRVHKFSDYPVQTEKAFYEGLKKLECLCVDKVIVTAASLEKPEEQDEHAQHIHRFPEQFKKLKKLTIGISPDAFFLNACLWSRDVMNFCENLEYSGDMYRSVVEDPEIAKAQFKTMLGKMFDLIAKSIRERNDKFPDKPNLKIYDFASFLHDKIIQDETTVLLNTPSFFKLVNVCKENSVKLYNVQAAWLQDATCSQSELFKPPSRERDPSSPVVSMVNMHGAAALMEMKNLEKLTIQATSKCCLFLIDWQRLRRAWPALKTIDVYVDSETLYRAVFITDKKKMERRLGAALTTKRLLDFLFVKIKRLALEEICLKYKEEAVLSKSVVDAVSGIGSPAPNLKKLSLINWSGSSETLIMGISGLNNLEELFFENCKKVGDSAFLKNGENEGLLANSKKLKKLSFKLLDKMSGITDKLFIEVICHMKLTGFYLSSTKPLTKVTVKGIRALKKGEFAASIEKFPFDAWSLAKVKKKDFKKLEEEFRSSQML